MFPSHSSRECDRQGFSLLELLASMAILLVLVLCITQILNGAMGATKVSRKKIDVDNEVRRVFDRMSADFAGMLDRPDADFLIRKNNGNDEMYFYAEAPARSTGTAKEQSSIALIGYKVNSDEQLARFSHGLEWNAAPPNGPVYLTFSKFDPLNKAGNVAATGSRIEGAFGSVMADENSYHVLGQGIFRIEIDFLLKPTVDVTTQTQYNAKFSSSPFQDLASGSSFGNRGTGLSDVEAIVVTVVAVDPNSLVLIKNLGDLAGKFSDMSGTKPSDVVTAWQRAIDSPSSLGIPASAAAGLRVYQRVFPLHHFLTTSL